MDALLTRLYERWGAWYLVLFAAAAIVNALLGIAIGVMALSTFLSATYSQLVKIVAVALAAGGVALGLCGLVLARDALRLMRWPAAPSAAAAPEVWHATVRFVNRGIARGVLIFSAVFVPVLLWGRGVVDASWSGVPAAFVGMEFMILFSGLLDFFAFELLFRPVRRDVGQYLPASFQPQHRPLTLRTRLLAVIFVASLSTSVVVASTQTWADSPEARVTIGVAVGLLVTASVGLLPASMLAHSEGLSRRALVDAARKVEAGDLDAAIPLAAGDETTWLAVSFNRMLVGLKEREHLLARNVELDEALQESLDEVQASRARIAAAADAERRRMERDLHDGAQQQLVLLQLRLGMLGRAVESDPQARRLVDELREDLSRALQELRDLAHGIYPVVLENEGLPGALRDAVARATIPASFDCDGARRYQPELETAVYFCCLEALQNVAKHAGAAARARVRVSEQDGALTFEVADDGHGYDAATTPPGAGLQNMTDRISALGGSVRVESAPGRGTTVAGTVPLAPSAAGRQC